MRIDISGLDKAKVLAALFNGSKLHGSFLGRRPGNPILTVDDAKDVIDGCGDSLQTNGLRFDYLYGRVLKVNLKEENFDPWLYDRDIGEGAAARIIDTLREKTSTST